ncbi:MAG: tetratricopeptide repeat protein [Gemmatimonadaceae bacterium]|nr:tetratricopeptide repeat protein [Gemmatimonadaceae bacterium]
MAAVSVPADVTAQALFSEAVTRHLAGDTAAARAAYEQVLRREPDHAEAANNLASILAQVGDQARALTLLQHAVGLQPDYGEAHNNIGIIWTERGDHKSALTAFLRAVALDATHAGWFNNLGNAYVELFRFAEAETAFDRGLALNPFDADAWSNRGLALRGLQRPADAMVSLRRALALAPSHVNALSNLGIILKEAKELDEAQAVLTKATEIDPANARLWGNYAAIFEAKGDFDRMRELALHALELDPGCAEACNLLANGEMEAGRYDASLALYDRALALDPGNSNANWNVALLWLLHGDFARGWPQFEWRKRLQSVVFDHGDYVGAEWTGDPLDGRDILLHSEQGVGDAIQFVRYAALLKERGAGRVYLECPYPIVPMLSGVRGVDGVVARGVALPRYDVHANLMSLPALLGTTLESVPATVPYIPVEPRTVRALVSAPSGTLTVGFVWAGNPLHARDYLRSAPLDAFRRLVQVNGTRFFSLQKGDAVDAALAKDPIP